MTRLDATGTVDPSEIDRFSKIADQWWDPNGKFRPLHRLSPVRIGYVRDAICQEAGRDPLAPRPLAGLRVLDVGCGGGLVAEPLARLGATVVGIDADETALSVARAHAAGTDTPVTYRGTTVETLAAAGERFDAVIALEVMEHVADVDLFVSGCAGVLETGGPLVFSTINRTPRAFALAIVGAEYVLRWLPRGTHQWRKFLRPSEVATVLRRHGLELGDLTGVVYSPLSQSFARSTDLSVNYMGRAVRR